MPQRNITQRGFSQGLVAVTDVYDQPDASVDRGSNAFLTRRGGLTTIDGSQVLLAFNGAVQTGFDKFLSSFFFAPIGVAGYYLALKKQGTFPLNAPTNLVASAGGTGGTLATATYFYKVVALDGTVGETAGSNEVSVAVTLGQVATLTWDIVPNAAGYAVFRSTSSGTEVQLINIPGGSVPQPSPLTTTVTFNDTGFSNSAAITTITLESSSATTGTALVVATGTNIATGATVVIAGNSVGTFNATWTVSQSLPGGQVVISGAGLAGKTIPLVGTGGTITANVSVPTTNTSKQTALYMMPPLAGVSVPLPQPYNDSNIIALFPAANSGPPTLGSASGGAGGSGGIFGQGFQGGGTPSGGVPGTVNQTPQMIGFTNRVVLCLGNGFAPQVYSDPNTSVNVAQVLTISTVAESGGDTETITLSAAPSTFVPVGSNIVVAGVANTAFNGVFVALGGTATNQSTPGTTLIVRNITATGSSSGGTVTVTTVPIYNTFQAAFPKWAASVSIAANGFIIPTTAPSNNFYFVAVQGGVTGATEPIWPTTKGARVADGTIIWQNAGLVNSAVPPPPAAAHAAVFGGALFLWNTFLNDTPPATTAPGQVGLDGPTSLRQSDVGNPFSWNPLNQAFIDKDDGTEGMGLATFTITAEGIPPQGSLIAFKNYSSYQVNGLFAAGNFSIQRLTTDMGCLAPRSIQFLPGHGIIRVTHLGFGVFDGVRDRVRSELIRPYLLPLNDSDVADIAVVDAVWVGVSWGAQTANPATYICACPIGDSGGKLTRMFSFDMIAGKWNPNVDLPFPVSILGQFRTEPANPVTVFGGFSDGALQRWQAGDITWYTGGGSFVQTVQWSARTPNVFADPAQRLYVRRLFLRVINTTGTTGLTVTVYLDGVAQPSVTTPPFAGAGDYEFDVAVHNVAIRFQALIAGVGQMELDRVSWLVTPKPVGVPRIFA